MHRRRTCRVCKHLLGLRGCVIHGVQLWVERVIKESEYGHLCLAGSRQS